MNKIKKLPLSTKLSLIFVSSYVFLAAIILLTDLILFNQYTRQFYTSLSSGLTQMMSDYIDTDKIDEYIEQNYSMPEYDTILRHFYTIKEQYPDIKYMYVYKFYPDKDYATVIFDIDEAYTTTPPQESIDWIGDKYMVDEPFLSKVNIITRGTQGMANVVTTHGEKLFTYISPVTDKNGNYICSACIDFDMTQLYHKNFLSIIQMLTILTFVMCVVLCINTVHIRILVSNPLTQMAAVVQGFTYDSDQSASENLQAFQDLSIQSNDEIGIIYNAFASNLQHNVDYLTNYRNAQQEAQAAAFMAYKDELTRVGNKAEYEKQLSRLKNAKEYGILMVDINNLKYVNDAFGHDKGDIYLKDCCQLICQVFSHSPVCRIGGDEFAVILLGHDYEHRNELVKLTKERFLQAYHAGQEPWTKLSAAIGLAVQENDLTVEQVVKKADQLMYQDKRTFKLAHPNALRANVDDDKS